MTSLRNFLALLAVAWVSVGCQSEHPAAVTVRSYNHAVAEAYRMNDPAPLAKYATDEEGQRVAVLIDLKVASRLVLESNLIEQRTLAVSQPNPLMAVVETEELWTYYDRPMDPGVAPGTKFKVRMRMRWEVIKANGIYKVDKGRTLSVTYLEPAGFKPAFGRRTTTAVEKAAGHQ